MANSNVLQDLQTRAVSLIRVDTEDAEANADRLVAILAAGLERLLRGSEGPEDEAVSTVDFPPALRVTTGYESNGYAEER